MQHLQTTLLSVGLFAGALTLSPQAAPTLAPQDDGPQPRSVLFPTPEKGFEIHDIANTTIADMLAGFSAVTGEQLMYSQGTASLLMEYKTQLLGDLEVAPRDVYPVVQSILNQNGFAMVDVSRDEPRVLAIKSIYNVDRNDILKNARFVPEHQLEEYARDAALIISTIVELPNVDVRPLSSSMQQLALDPTTMRIIPFPQSNQVLLMGFAKNIHRIVQTLRHIDAGSARARLAEVVQTKSWRAHEKIVSEDLVAINAALEQYALFNGGKYPESLAPLVMPDTNGTSYLDEKHLIDPYGDAYLYTPPTALNPKPEINLAK
jgi:hypothetical protein